MLKVQRKAYVFNDHFGVARCFSESGWEVVDNIKDADIGVLTGGEDISPAIYNHKQHPSTYPGPSRDRKEIQFYELAVDLRKPIVGICRGAQLINALQGGSMYQDVDGHHGRHEVIDFVSKELVETNSVHHQMMIPASHGKVIAGCIRKASSRERMEGNKIVDDGPGIDPEVIVYPDHAGKPSFLCFQAHPEFDHGGSTTQYFFKLISRELGL